MSNTLRISLLVSRGVLSAVLLMASQQACSLHPKKADSRAGHAVTREGCAPELSEERIYEIATEAIRKVGDDQDILRTDYEVTIESSDCEYVFTAIRKGLEAVDGISMRIDRSGRVKSFPWCCPLGHCPELCEAEPLVP